MIRSGDKLFLRQYQSSGARGGMNVVFSDGTNTNWSATDQDGQQLNNDATQQSWHYRRVDLSSYAGKSISNIYLVQESTTAAGNWDIYFTDLAIVSTDGTVRPLYNRQKTISLSASGTSGVTGRMYEVSHVSSEVQYPDQTTTFYHGDHLGSARLMSSVNGYPVWQATYLPFGYEKNPQSSVNAYKFTGYERDSESGLDYANQRYYNSTMARFMTADPLGASANVADPQSWNRYAYVLNSPTNFIDPLGLCDEEGKGGVSCSQNLPPQLRYMSGISGIECKLDGVVTPCERAFQQIGNGSAYPMTINGYDCHLILSSGRIRCDSPEGGTGSFYFDPSPVPPSLNNGSPANSVGSATMDGQQPNDPHPTCFWGVFVRALFKA